MWNDSECIYIHCCDDLGGDDDDDEVFVCADRLSADCWGFTLRSPSAPEEDQTDEDGSDVVQKIETMANETNRKWLAPGAYDLTLFVLQFANSKQNWALKNQLQLTKCRFWVFGDALLINVRRNLLTSGWCVLSTEFCFVIRFSHHFGV